MVDYAMVTGTEALESDVRERTILTTDVVGSTALLRRYPNDMMSAMDLHDRILHDAIRRHSGDPFRSTGDGVLAIFDRPLDAVMAAIESQREMRRIAWGPTGRLQIRFGIHTGMTRARGDNDFFGPALPTATRLQSAANADQILLSGVTVERLASDLLRTPFQIADLGDHHFKGIEPIRVHQVSTSDLPNAFPPIGGKRESASGNLPANLSSFLGRERELDELAQMALESRLFTLIGPGGIGKTRLAIEFARSLEATFPDGAWLVDLSALERDSEVWPALAEALLILPVPGTEPRIQVLERLHHARAILVMDNCEHVIDPVADAVTELGSSCGELFLINTSRRPLGVEGEALYEVSSLNSGAQGAVGAGQSVAARLFEERARLGNRRFQPSAADHAVIERICANLDCIPLAIEIAAAQLRRHSLVSIESGVTKPLDLQASIFRRRSGRHQTLRQTLEWSYELLDPASRQVLQRLSVFSGSFHEEQALAVCATDIQNEAEVLRGIDELVETSLLARDTGRHHLRMLQTVQGFAREMLDRATPLQTVEARHCEVYAARCRQLGQQIATVNEAKAANAIYDELSNLRAAFERAITRDLKLAAQLAAPLFLFNYSHRGAETGHWYERIMARGGAEELEEAPLFLAGAAGHAFHDEGNQTKAAAFLERGFKIEAAASSRTSQGWLSHVAGQMAQWSGDTKGCIDRLAAAATQAKRAGNTACEVMSMCVASYVMARMGDRERARELVRQATEIAEPAMQPTLMGYVYYARGGVAQDPKRAIDEYQVAAEWAVMAGNHLGSQRVKQLIADLQAADAAPAEALAIHVRHLIDLPKHGATFYTWITIRAVLQPLLALQADQHFAVLAGALRASPLKLDRAARNAVDTARQRLGEAAFEEAASRGSRFDLTEARGYIIDVWRGMGAG